MHAVIVIMLARSSSPVLIGPLVHTETAYWTLVSIEDIINATTLLIVRQIPYFMPSFMHCNL